MFLYNPRPKEDFMFSWFISLLLLFGSNGKAVPAASVGLGGSANPHVTPADNPQPGPAEPADTDGQGKGSGG